MITIKEFEQVDIRVAAVKSAEPHPNADKLLVLRIDAGESEERTIVAGLKGHYTCEELVGKQIVVVVNLQPVKLRGVESNGMLLAATDGDRVVLLTTDKEVSAGCKIR